MSKSGRSIIFVLFVLMLIAGCRKNNTALSSNQEPGDFDDLAVFKTSSPYNQVIADCVRPNSEEQLCRLEKLPLLGMDVDNPTISDIMDRVVVSHAWMGERFEQVLQELPAAMLPIFKGLTAVVIDDDIRPAYYTAETGAIYLDPAYLWLTVPEKRVINIKDDYRAGFADPLAFRSYSQYTKDGQRVASRGSLEDDSTRGLADIVPLLARLLLHELGHANDFFPPDMLDDLSLSDTAAVASSKVGNRRISSQLISDTPLNSSIMYSLGGVMFRGYDPTAADLLITAEEVGAEFEPDGAADDYAYSSQFEDTAMLFDISMMKYFFDIDYEMVFTDAPADGAYCNEYIIRWGQRDRIGDSNVKARAQFVVTELMPGLETELFFQDMPPPSQITTGVDLCTIFSSNSTAQGMSKSAHKREISPAEFRKPYL